MHIDINRRKNYELQKIKVIIMHANGVGIVFSVDSNARSTSWYDVLNNKLGK